LIDERQLVIFALFFGFCQFDPEIFEQFICCFNLTAFALHDSAQCCRIDIGIFAYPVSADISAFDLSPDLFQYHIFTSQIFFTTLIGILGY
jgi:hypothetical protein